MDLDQIFKIKSEEQFEKLALEIFKYQFEKNAVYRSYCDLLYINPADIHSYIDIPFLPIQFFKTHEVLSSKDPVQAIFRSSGTSNQKTSAHHINDLDLYERSFLKGFENIYGPPQDYTILALLPSYLERKDSSLVYMVERLIGLSKDPASGFYLDNYQMLSSNLKACDRAGKKVLLIGVSFALLNLIEEEQFRLKNTLIMETGGMKGRRQELIREELHQRLKDGFGVKTIASEYGMTELLSQAYSNTDGLFNTPPWMKILIRDTDDPFTILSNEQTGGLNIIDLANVNSCSFIATQDLGKLHADGTFEVLGRFDHSDIRGCNLMVI